MTAKKKPARWRKARNPNIGTRWSTPTNNMIWNRDYGDDIELWRGEVRLAVVDARGDCAWQVTIGYRPFGNGGTLEIAKAQAKAAALAQEPQEGSGRP